MDSMSAHIVRTLEAAAVHRHPSCCAISRSEAFTSCAGLKPRDVALARALNSDRLSQLVVKADDSTLDLPLTQPFTDAGLPANAQCMLFMTRGTGTQEQKGLLLVPKLDYLQLLAVEWVRDAGARFGAAFLRAVRDLSEDARTQVRAPCACLYNEYPAHCWALGMGARPNTAQCAADAKGWEYPRPYCACIVAFPQALGIRTAHGVTPVKISCVRAACVQIVHARADQSGKVGFLRRPELARSLFTW